MLKPKLGSGKVSRLRSSGPLRFSLGLNRLGFYTLAKSQPKSVKLRLTKTKEFLITHLARQLESSLGFHHSSITRRPINYSRTFAKTPAKVSYDNRKKETKKGGSTSLPG